MKRAFLLFAAVALVSRPAGGQATLVDEGSFTISRAGDRIGREDFSIRHVPTTEGAHETLTRGVVVTGSQRVTVDLSTDSVGLPVRFQSKAVDGRETGDNYRAEVMGRRYSSRTTRGSGESARELMIPAGALIVEDGVMHPLQFVVSRGPGSLSAVVPSRGVVVTLTVEAAGTDRVSIALQSVEARKFVVREGAGGMVREVWVDAAGRLLKVSIPAQRLVAIRDDAPRAPTR
ncbi:MAG: hypothetical protein Q8K55_13965 [Gemmatimonadaceae bacterium]|nr:hypothetical protein [Gemmatimonadaceae bacterium]